LAKVHLLLDGFFVCDKTIFLPEGRHVRYTAAAKSLLIISGKEKILVDTGIGDIPDRPAYRELRRTLTIKRKEGNGIVPELAKHGLRPEQITSVINTHLHNAHAGNNNLFRGAKFYIAGDEFSFIDNLIGEDPNQTAYLREKYDKARDIVQVKGAYKLTDEVTILPTPGHTLGHQSVVVERDGRPLVYSGDVSPLKENVVKRIPMSSYDRQMNLESMKKLLRIAGARWIFTHDSDQLNLRQAFTPRRPEDQ
jgi:glyoxylase-like metal-dependent hydrolase (beta-lactamase superfamily II)